MYPMAVFWTLDGKSFRNYTTDGDRVDVVVDNVVSIEDFRGKRVELSS
jgi:hypothetical protein